MTDGTDGPGALLGLTHVPNLFVIAHESGHELSLHHSDLDLPINPCPVLPNPDHTIRLMAPGTRFYKPHTAHPCHLIKCEWDAIHEFLKNRD